MAFLDFNQPLAGPSKTVGASAATLNASGFSPQEWQIVGLARGDGLRSLRGPGRFARLRRWIFGEEVQLSLASGRLEALRRLAVHAWHRGYAVPLSALDEFRAAGFTATQLEMLLATISVARHATRGGRR